MEINTEDYQICYDPATATVIFIGALRLSGPAEYAPIAQFLTDVAEVEPTKITLNLQQLEFLNSSGINMLSKFIIEVRKTARVQMAVQGSQSIAWHGKSLRNFQRLMPGLQVEFL
ncbi:slr1659 superfamily regulator [Microcoleus sp. F4-D5]|uniref:slr1659 superfamily regulator n=1 Tax=Microcoleus sp. F4-D5 TaxID=2818760 RepID=UPI002FCF4B63